MSFTWNGPKVVTDHGFQKDGDEFDAFKNERDYIKQIKKDGTTVAAMDWAATEIARLRALLTETGQKAIEAAAENERLRAALKRITNCAWSAPGAWDAQDIAREALGK